MTYTLTIYEQRKMLFLAVAHAMATMVVWSHFFFIKYRATAKVPRGANLYWWKRLTPPFEFGAMHAILFQMALLPLTMARQSVAALSTTSFGKEVCPAAQSRGDAHSPRVRHGFFRVRVDYFVLRVLRTRLRAAKVR